MSRKIEALLAEYGDSHQNATNKAVHWICVPVIVWTVMAGLWSLPQPGFMAGIGWLNWLTLVLVLSDHLRRKHYHSNIERFRTSPFNVHTILLVAVCYAASPCICVWAFQRTS